jgi:uncharacterized membrane protein
LTSSDFYHAVTATAFSQFIQRTHGLIASIQMVHIICLAAVFALGLALALSLAGRGFESLDSLSRRFEPAIWILLALLLATGALLIIAEPVRSLPKTVFYIKMALIVLAVVYMIVWCSIIVAGRMIAYY